MANFTPFHHPRRECHWCGGGFKPLDTLSPHCTEYFCSTECALERYQAKALEVMFPGTYEVSRKVAVEQRTHRLAEVAQRLRGGRERARAQKGAENDG